MEKRYGLEKENIHIITKLLLDISSILMFFIIFVFSGNISSIQITIELVFNFVLKIDMNESLNVTVNKK